MLLACGRSGALLLPAAPAPVLGAAVNWARLQAPGPYQRLFLAHFHALTPENEFKMEALSPAPGRLDFSQADAIMRWADVHGIPVHGHTLVWAQQLPGWLTSRTWSRAELRDVLRWYVTCVVRHFRGRVATWDVVNEPLADDGSLRPNVWRRVLGPAYLALALRWAHAADPAARLLVNDYGIERSGPKADGMARLLRALRAARVPVDGVGLQSHLTTSWARPRRTWPRRCVATPRSGSRWTCPSSTWASRPGARRRPRWPSRAGSTAPWRGRAGSSPPAGG